MVVSCDDRVEAGAEFKLNTVIERGVDVPGDVADINAGTAAPDVNGNWVVNGRTYGMHECGTVIPIEGPGFHPLSRGGFKALVAYNEFGNTPAAADWMARRKIPAEAQAEGLRVHEAILR